MKKNINIIEEQSETLEINNHDMKLDELAKHLAHLRPEYRKEVIRTAKKLAKAYKSYQDAMVTLGGLGDLK